jgi:hypothetical protein
VGKAAQKSQKRLLTNTFKVSVDIKVMFSVTFIYKLSWSVYGLKSLWMISYTEIEFKMCVLQQSTSPAHSAVFSGL